MNVHVHPLQTGRLVGNETFLRGSGWSALLRRREPVDFPVLSYVIEHPDGHIAIDTGLASAVRVPRTQRRFVPRPIAGPEDEIALQMRARGLRAADVKTVVLTHLDWDHAGGIAAFPNARVLVHRPEYEFASSLMGRMRYQPRMWPPDFEPALYDLDPDPCGPFPESKTLTADGAIRLVPLPGHSIGQVGAVVQSNGHALLLAADHVLRQDWFVEDLRAGRLLGLGMFFPKLARETSRRIHRFARGTPTVLLPAHDSDAPARLATMQPLRF
jgi:N-acyl homoserine lactone hydrolase